MRAIHPLTAFVPAAALALLLAPAAVAADQNEACGLATAAELQAVTGGKVSPPNGGKMGANAEMCSAHTDALRILMRVAKAKGGSSKDAAAEGLKMFKDMGAEVDLKTFGAITCSTLIPPKSMEQYGFNTTCSVVKNGKVAAIEMTAKARKDMVPIDRLRPLAEKMAARVH